VHENWKLQSRSTVVSAQSVQGFSGRERFLGWQVATGQQKATIAVTASQKKLQA
jgi:hypothetical protein